MWTSKTRPKYNRDKLRYTSDLTVLCRPGKTRRAGCCARAQAIRQQKAMLHVRIRYRTLKLRV